MGCCTCVASGIATGSFIGSIRAVDVAPSRGLGGRVSAQSASRLVCAVVSQGSVLVQPHRRWALRRGSAGAAKGWLLGAVAAVPAMMGMGTVDRARRPRTKRPPQVERVPKQPSPKKQLKARLLSRWTPLSDRRKRALLPRPRDRRDAVAGVDGSAVRKSPAPPAHGKSF